MTWTMLTGYVVIKTNDKAVLVRDDMQQESWIPRSVVMDGDYLVDGDRDLVVRSWFCDKEGLFSW